MDWAGDVRLLALRACNPCSRIKGASVLFSAGGTLRFEGNVISGQSAQAAKGARTSNNVLVANSQIRRLVDVSGLASYLTFEEAAENLQERRFT